ncbi:MAG: hypothetical protein AAF658_09905, partial [Myxococcota bacterium]
PTSDLQVSGSTIFVACSGDFSGDGDGGIVSIDTTSGTTSLVISDADLGGYPNGLVVGANGELFTLVAVPGAELFSTQEMRAVRVSGGVASTLYSSPGFTLSGLAVLDGELYVGNRSSDATQGIWTVELDTGTVSGPIATTVPPFAFVVR